MVQAGLAFWPGHCPSLEYYHGWFIFTCHSSHILPCHSSLNILAHGQGHSTGLGLLHIFTARPFPAFGRNSIIHTHRSLSSSVTGGQPFLLLYGPALPPHPSGHCTGNGAFTSAGHLMASSGRFSLTGHWPVIVVQYQPHIGLACCPAHGLGSLAGSASSERPLPGLPSGWVTAVTNVHHRIIAETGSEGWAEGSPIQGLALNGGMSVSLGPLPHWPWHWAPPPTLGWPSSYRYIQCHPVTMVTQAGSQSSHWPLPVSHSPGQPGRRPFLIITGEPTLYWHRPFMHTTGQGSTHWSQAAQYWGTGNGLAQPTQSIIYHLENSHMAHTSEYCQPCPPLASPGVSLGPLPGPPGPGQPPQVPAPSCLTGNVRPGPVSLRSNTGLPASHNTVIS